MSRDDAARRLEILLGFAVALALTAIAVHMH